MEFSSLSNLQKKKLSTLKKKYGNLSGIQKSLQKFCPIIVIGESGSGKDTLIGEVQKVMGKDFGCVLLPSLSRYLSRERRHGEETSYLNFISENEFKKRKFGFTYSFGGNLYGLDTKSFSKEIEQSNIFVVTGNYESLENLFETTKKISSPHSIPPLVIHLVINPQSNVRLLEKRGGNPREVEMRKKIIQEKKKTKTFFNNLSYSTYRREILRSPSLDPNKNQKHFNENILKMLEYILDYIERYL